MNCIYDARWCGFHGIGRFASEVAKRIDPELLTGSSKPMSPVDPFRLSFRLITKNKWFLSPGYNAPIFSRKPFVLTVHDLNHIDRKDNSSLLKVMYYSTVLRYLVRNAHAVLTVSNYSRMRIVDWFGVDQEKVFNVGNGVSNVFLENIDMFAPGYEYVLCVSNRRGHKNEPGLLKAFARADIPINIKIIMTGTATEELLVLAEKLGLSERLVFSGKVSEVQLAGLYKGAIFLVFPSFYEGFGLPIIEAFASGTPVITSNVTSMPEIAGDAALLVNPNSVDDMASTMSRLFHSPTLRSELICRGKLRINNYSWDAVADRVRRAVISLDM